MITSAGKRKPANAERGSRPGTRQSRGLHRSTLPDHPLSRRNGPPLPDPYRNRPQVMAALRNTAISALHLAGLTNIAAATRYHARDSNRPLTLLSIG
jgi:hypothetical protein